MSVKPPLRVSIKTEPPIAGGHGRVSRVVLEVASTDGNYFNLGVDGIFLTEPKSNNISGLDEVRELQVFAPDGNGSWTRVHIFGNNLQTSSEFVDAETLKGDDTLTSGSDFLPRHS